MRGWINCFGRFHPSALLSTLNRINDYLVRWRVRKYKRFKRKGARAREALSRHAGQFPGLFAHSRQAMTMHDWTMGGTTGRWEPCRPRGLRTVLRAGE
ncbi:hypothetical protein GCM10012280_49140 [Wenjunlia tyrosinilytica]|uniref:Group II intron maturase-specific domain-containing protein n=1 Tax=Wenjunlia tyrosinilytica TaxID=1544741 RepID=A0A917ZU91_9ACTN|nr:hypothetical protein GCM10012280_49140 [Wenjunlia tyrosinilytica]